MIRGIIFIVFCTLVGCSQKIVSYTNPKADYESFQSYRMVNPKLDNKLSSESSLAFELIKESISNEMARRSYVSSSVSPDLTLRYELASSTRVETTTSQSFTFPSFQINSRTIHEAVLLLEIFDQKKKLVWQGSYDLNQERKEKKVKKVIENAVGRIFTTYPYNAKDSNPDPSLMDFNPQKEQK